MIGRVLLEAEMRSTPMIVLPVGIEHAPQVRLVEDDDVIEALASNRADHTFDVRILPGTRRRGDNLGDAYAGQTPLERVASMWSRSRCNQRGAVSSGNASTTCCAGQAAVGWSVTLTCTRRRRSCASTTSTNSIRPVSVGTVKKSIDAADAR